MPFDEGCNDATKGEQRLVNVPSLPLPRLDLVGAAASNALGPRKVDEVEPADLEQILS